jgi:hypothetical protein
LLNNIQAYWSFNLGGSLSGVPDFGTVSLFQIAPAAPTTVGKIGNAILCSPWSDLIGGYFPSNALSTLYLNQDVSISAWARPNTVSSSYNFGTLFHVTNINSESLFVSFDDNVITFGGYVNFGFESFFYIPPSGWAANQWLHIVLTHNASTRILKLYLDGVLVSTSTPRTAYSAAAGYEVYALSDFQSGPSIGSFGGTMDEFGIWQKLFTSTDVTNLYNSGAGLDSIAFQT